MYTIAKEDGWRPQPADQSETISNILSAFLSCKDLHWLAIPTEFGDIPTVKYRRVQQRIK